MVLDLRNPKESPLLTQLNERAGKETDKKLEMRSSVSHITSKTSSRHKIVTSNKTISVLLWGAPW